MKIAIFLAYILSILKSNKIKERNWKNVGTEPKSISYRKKISNDMILIVRASSYFGSRHVTFTS